MPCDTSSTKSVMRKPSPVSVMPPTMMPAVAVAMPMPIMLRLPSFRPWTTSLALSFHACSGMPRPRKKASSGRCVSISTIMVTVAQKADSAGESSSTARHQISTPMGIR